jgi:hypothetical protein
MTAALNCEHAASARMRSAGLPGAGSDRRDAVQLSPAGHGARIGPAVSRVAARVRLDSYRSSPAGTGPRPDARSTQAHRAHKPIDASDVLMTRHSGAHSALAARKCAATPACGRRRQPETLEPMKGREK